jgi:O-succinylbenzoate synthase
MPIDIKRIELFVVELPMTEPFKVSFGTVTSRRLVLVKMTDTDGCEGWGEAATLDLPIYKADFPETVIAVIERAVWPAVQTHGAFASPEAFDDHLNFIRGHYFAKAALSMAVYDIAAQKAGKNLAAYIGGQSTAITLSRTLSIMPDAKTMLAKADEMASAGFRYLKLKIAQASDYAFAKALRDAYPDFPLRRHDRRASWSGGGHGVQHLERLQIPRRLHRPALSDRRFCRILQTPALYS